MAAFQRRAKDLATDCYNVWSKWCEIHKKNVNLVENIANKKILLLDPVSSASTDYDFDEDLLKSELANLCQHLRDVLDEFQRLTEKMEKNSSNFAALKLLVESSPVDIENSLFSTWSVEKVDERVKNISRQLKEEILCKFALLETLPLAADRSIIEICVASWLHQPYLNENEIHYLITAIATEARLL